MRIIIISIVLLFFLTACKKDKPVIVSSQTDTDAKLLWTSPISDGKLVEGTFFHQVAGDKLLVSGIVNGEVGIVAKELETGDDIWEWNDLEGNGLINFHYPSISEDIFIDVAYPTLYSLDINNGTTNWKITDQLTAYGYGNIHQIENDFFFSGIKEVNDTLWGVIYKGNISNGEISELVTPAYMDDATNFVRNEVGVILQLNLVFLDNKYKLLASILECDDEWNCPTYMSLFDLDSQSWDYELKLVSADNKHGSITNAIVQDEYIYHTSGKYISCNNVITGESVWVRELNATAGIMLVSEEDNKIIVSTYSGERTTYGIDTSTGNVSWITETTGNNGQKYALNGIVYFTSDGDGELHALDIATGDYIWKLESPDIVTNGDSWFKGELTGIPGENGEKGKIFTSSYLNTFCFEAAR